MHLLLGGAPSLALVLAAAALLGAPLRPPPSLRRPSSWWRLPLPPMVTADASLPGQLVHGATALLLQQWAMLMMHHCYLMLLQKMVLCDARTSAALPTCARCFRSTMDSKLHGPLPNAHMWGCIRPTSNL